MKPIDSVPKVLWKPARPKLDEKRMLTPKDAELTQKLKSFHHDIHHEFFGAVEDILMGPQVFLPNALIKRLCDLVHVHALQLLSDLSNFIEWAWLPKHSEALLAMIHSIYPPLPIPIIPTNSPMSSSMEAQSSQHPSISQPWGSSHQTAPKQPSSHQGKQQKCSLCGMMGHKSKWPFKLFPTVS